VVHLRRLHQAHGDRVEFLFVYIRDAYHHVPANLRNFGAHPDSAERRQIVREGLEHHQIRFTCLLDNESVKVERLYEGFPKRLFLVDINGRIASDSGNDPSALISWDEIDRWMEQNGRAAELPR